jgi:HAD superfamily hydrolase (TIGR01509 family)
MPFDALIFDCDGVLIDSEIVVCRIAAEELTKLGYQISTEQVIRRFAGRPDHEMRAEIEQDWGQPIPDGYRVNVDTRTVQAYATELNIMPGLQEALARITLPICVASSSFPEKLRLGLQTVGLYDRFMPNVISGVSVAYGKPEPDIFIFAAGWMKASPKRCIAVEDSVPGTRSARRAGMQVLGFTGGAHCGPDHGKALLHAGANITFSNMDELPLLLETFHQGNPSE